MSWIKPEPIEDMEISVSEILRGKPVEKIWHIRGWKKDFELLKNHAQCTMVILEKQGDLGVADASLRFTFKVYEGITAKPTNNYQKEEWLSLCASMITGVHQQYFSVTVDQLDKELKYSNNLLQSKQIHYVTENDKKDMIVKDKFYLLSEDNNVYGKYDLLHRSQDEDFILKISVTPLFISAECCVSAAAN